MDIYKIYVQHFSQKDSHESIETFLLASSVDSVYRWVDKEKQYGSFSDREEDCETFDIYDDKYDVIGTETFKEKMIRIGGEYFDEDLELHDLYYGATIYGWEKAISNPSDAEITVLRKLGVLDESD